MYKKNPNWMGEKEDMKLCTGKKYFVKNVQSVEKNIFVFSFQESFVLSSFESLCSNIFPSLDTTIQVIDHGLRWFC